MHECVHKWHIIVGPIGWKRRLPHSSACSAGCGPEGSSGLAAVCGSQGTLRQLAAHSQGETASATRAFTVQH